MIIKFFNGNVLEGETKPCFSHFPDGQPHVKVNPIKNGFDRTEIHCSLRNPNELFNLQMVHDALSIQNDNIHIYIYWLFGARMDRRIDNSQPATLELVKRNLESTLALLNCHFLDLHNQDFFPYSHHISLKPIADKVLEDFGACDIYFPDKGARKRYASLFPDHNILCGKKVRDSQTGHLSGFALESGERQNHKIIIWDDICCGGGTFLGQYDVLMKLGYNEVGLYTTHGIYSKGIGVLDNFAAIYRTNSFVFGLEMDDGGYPINHRFVLQKWNRIIKDFCPSVIEIK